MGQPRKSKSQAQPSPAQPSPAQPSPGLDKARQDKTRQDKARQDKTRQKTQSKTDKTRHDKTRQGKARQTQTRHDRQGNTRPYLDHLGTSWANPDFVSCTCFFLGEGWIGHIAGEIDSSILVVPGTHARLENIDSAGRWIEDEVFEVGNKTVHHKKGESVGNTMVSWRALREAAPELFTEVRVWQSPTAFVDGVI